MTFTNFEDLEEYVSELVQKELNYKTDLIAQSNWSIIEEDVPEKVMEHIREEFGESDLEEELDSDYVDELFQNTLRELEPEKGYRANSLWSEEIEDDNLEYYENEGYRDGNYE